MSIALIVIGFIVARFGALVFKASETNGGQSTLGGLLTLAAQLGGWGLIIWGIVLFFA